MKIPVTEYQLNKLKSCLDGHTGALELYRFLASRINEIGSLCFYMSVKPENMTDMEIIDMVYNNSQVI